MIHIDKEIIDSFIRGDEHAVASLVAICRDSVIDMVSEVLLSTFIDGTMDPHSQQEIELAAEHSLRIIVDELLSFAGSVRKRDNYSECFSDFIEDIVHRCATQRLVTAIEAEQFWAVRKLDGIVSKQALSIVRGDFQDAEDLAQDTISKKIIPKIGQFNPENGSGTCYHNFRGWIYKIATNLYIEKIRKDKTRKDNRTEMTENIPPSESFWEVNDPHERLERFESALTLAKEKRQCLIDEYDKAVERMPSALKDIAREWKEIILSMGEYGDYVEDLAERLAVTAGAVYNRRRRLMGMAPYLKELLQQMSDRTDQIERVEDLLEG